MEGGGGFGDVMAALSQRIALPQTMALAETRATHRTVTLAQELSIFRVQVEGDCHVVIQALTSQARCTTFIWARG